ncbi:hypothetical protein J5U21_00735 [Saccharolobus shibatae]|uniref:Uncharacterized protein n=1 Tax=Saccharolobus shibatae TaxID=2286 RepID=A0A8F5BTC5_9CREN|nr:hypothetical protein J5U21_00735 [Saccharolobus shibatae]
MACDSGATIISAIVIIIISIDATRKLVMNATPKYPKVYISVPITINQILLQKV